MSVYQAMVRLPAARAVSAEAQPVLGEYRQRLRVAERPVTRGVSRESVLFDMIYDSDQAAEVPEAVDHSPGYEQLVKLLLLQPNWDGQGAAAPNKAAIDVARAVVSASKDVGFNRPLVSADVEGGVATYFFGGTQLEDGGWSHQGGVLVDNDGDALLYLRDRRSPGSTAEDVGPDALSSAVQRVFRFIADAF